MKGIGYHIQGLALAIGMFVAACSTSHKVDRLRVPDAPLDPGSLQHTADSHAYNPTATPSGLPVDGAAASYERQPHSAEEMHALQELVKEQALELDRLRKDVRALRRKLSKMEPRRKMPMKQDLPSTPRKYRL